MVLENSVQIYNASSSINSQSLIQHNNRSILKQSLKGEGINCQYLFKKILIFLFGTKGSLQLEKGSLQLRKCSLHSIKLLNFSSWHKRFTAIGEKILAVGKRFTAQHKRFILSKLRCKITNNQPSSNKNQQQDADLQFKINKQL